MTRAFFPAAALALAPALILMPAGAPPLSAQVRQGGPYQIQAESLNSGGAAVSGGTVYSQTATLSSLAGTASSPKYTLLSGFTAQLGAGGGTGAGEGKAAFAAWQTAIFGGTGDPSAAAAADPDRDGVTNLLEFMFNLDPLAPGTPVVAAGAGNSGLPLIREETLGGARFITVEYIRRKNSGVQAVQETADLQTWGAAAFTALGGPVAVSPVYERVRLLVTPAISPGAPRFARLSITVQ